jgi:hypothetical protein
VSPRPPEWHPVCPDGDPVPGDPDAVGSLAGRYQTTARRISDAAARLRRIAGVEGWDSRAGRRFRERAIEVSDKVSSAYQRYEKAGVALADYAEALRGAQRLADGALGRAQDAEVELIRARALVECSADPASLDHAAHGDYQRRAGAAAAVIAEAQRAVARAVAGWDAAARKAAGEIHDVAVHDGLKDGFVEDIVPALKAIADIAGAIAAVCGILSLVVGWVPIIGQALAGILGTIALIAGLVSFLCNLTLLATGHGGVWAVVLDAVGLATFGIGRLFTSASRVSAVAGRGTAWRAAGPMRAAGEVSGRLQALIGGKLAGASEKAIRNAPRSIPEVKPALLKPGAIFGDFAADWATVRGNLHALPTTGTATATEALAQTMTAAADTFRSAWRADGVRGVSNVLWGNADLARDVAQLNRIHPRLAELTDVHRFAKQAYAQNDVLAGAQSIGSGVDFGQALSMALGSVPDVTGSYFGPAGQR